MPDTQNPATIDDLLRDARVLGDEYRDYQPPTADERLARAAARRAQRSTPPAPGRAPAAAPNRGPEHEQARHELDLAVALVLNAKHAAASLAGLADAPVDPDPDGALVFACLLHLTAREQAARFWWKFAAGAGNPTAAFCLYLDHRRNAEYRDADYWRRQSTRLRADPLPPSRAGRAVQSLLPPRELRALLAECHRGHHPHLPLQIEGAINQLPVDTDDALYGEIPAPSPHLVTTLEGRPSP